MFINKSGSLFHVTRTRLRSTKVKTAHCVYLLYAEKQANRSGSQERQCKTECESSVTSATFANITCRKVFWVLPTHWPCCLPVAPNYTIIFLIHLEGKEKKCYYTPIPYSKKKKKKSTPSFLILRTHNDRETSAKQRERHYSGELVSSQLSGFSINNRFSSAVSQIKASQLLTYPTQLWGEEASVARQNS